MGNESRLNPFAKDTTRRPPEAVRDHFGRILREGDRVMLPPGMITLFQVTRIAPVLDPTAPANLMDITVSAMLRFRAARDQWNAEFIRVIEQDELTQPTPRPEPPGLAIVRPVEPEPPPGPPEEAV